MPRPNSIQFRAGTTIVWESFFSSSSLSSNSLHCFSVKLCRCNKFNLPANELVYRSSDIILCINERPTGVLFISDIQTVFKKLVNFRDFVLTGVRSGGRWIDAIWGSAVGRKRVDGPLSLDQRSVNEHTYRTMNHSKWSANMVALKTDKFPSVSPVLAVSAVLPFVSITHPIQAFNVSYCCCYKT